MVCQIDLHSMLMDTSGIKTYKNKSFCVVTILWIHVGTRRKVASGVAGRAKSSVLARKINNS